MDLSNETLSQKCWFSTFETHLFYIFISTQSARVKRAHTEIGSSSLQRWAVVFRVDGWYSADFESQKGWFVRWFMATLTFPFKQTIEKLENFLNLLKIQWANLWSMIGITWNNFNYSMVQNNDFFSEIVASQKECIGMFPAPRPWMLAIRTAGFTSF